MVYFLFVYLNTGIIFLIPREYWNEVLIEIGLAFIFLLAVFWSHTRISKLSRSEGFQKMPSFVRGVLEALLVVVVTISLDSLISLFPLSLMTEEPLPKDRIRTSFVVGSIISLFFYYFVERERSKKLLQAELLRSEKLQKENFRAQLDSLKNQMNPHFLFNSLNVLNSLIFVDIKKASEFTRQLSDVYRAFLDNSDKSLVSLQEEMELGMSYASLLQTRFSENLKILYAINDELLTHRLPPGAVQMLLENAVKHNGFSANAPLQIEVATTGDHLMVKNNIKVRRNTERSSGHGLKNIQKRYEYLSGQKVEIAKNDQFFIVKLPLLKPESNADSDY